MKKIGTDNFLSPKAVCVNESFVFILRLSSSKVCQIYSEHDNLHELLHDKKYRINAWMTYSIFHKMCYMILLHLVLLWLYKVGSRLASSQWETSLQSNAVCHWLDANLKPALLYIHSIVHSRDTLTHILQKCSIGTGTIAREASLALEPSTSPECLWSNPEGYGYNLSIPKHKT